MWKEPSHPGHSVDVHVPKNKVGIVTTMLKSNAIPFEVMIEDVDVALEEEEISNRKIQYTYRYDYTKYNSWFEVNLVKNQT